MPIGSGPNSYKKSASKYAQLTNWVLYFKTWHCWYWKVPRIMVFPEPNMFFDPSNYTKNGVPSAINSDLCPFLKSNKYTQPWYLNMGVYPKVLPCFGEHHFSKPWSILEGCSMVFPNIFQVMSRIDQPLGCFITRIFQRIHNWCPLRFQHQKQLLLIWLGVNWFKNIID